VAESPPLRWTAMTPAELEGSIIGPVTHRVDPERVSAFVDATGDRPERWTESAPPGYAAALLFSVAGILLNDERIQPYLATLIHVDQHFTFQEAIRVGSAIDMTGTVDRVRERGGAYFVTFSAVGTAGGDVVLDSRSTFLMSDEAASESAAGRAEPAADARGPNEQPPAARAPVVGDTQSTAKSASRSDLVRYSAATRDFNPLHWDHASARAAGLDGVVVHGLLMLSWLAQQCSISGAGPSPIATIKVRFRSALAPAVAAAVESVVRDLSPEGADAQLSIRVVADDSDVVTGSAVVRVEGVTP
jgi:acyl dehydratase